MQRVHHDLLINIKFRIVYRINFPAFLSSKKDRTQPRYLLHIKCGIVSDKKGLLSERKPVAEQFLSYLCAFFCKRAVIDDRRDLSDDFKAYLCSCLFGDL